MFFFFLPVLAVLAALAGGVVFAAAYVFIQQSPGGGNRFGPPSPTHTVTGAIGRGFTRLFDFRGRANRKDFWSFAILAGGLGFVALPTLAIIGLAVANAAVDVRLPVAIAIAVVVFVLGSLAGLACLSMAIRRLHDVNRSGLWVMLLGVFGYFILLYWFLQPSVRSVDEAAQVFT